MRKSHLVIGIFVVLGAVALVFGLQQVGSGSISGINHPIPPTGNPGTVDPNTVPNIVSSSESNIQFEWKLGNPYVYSSGNGEAFLDLRVSGKQTKNADRKPMNLVLVIDRSGSMASEGKLDQVKNAAVDILNNLNSTDRLAIVTYDDSINTLLSSTIVENKDHIRSLIYSLSPGGSTNLCGGMQAGFSEARRNFRKDSINRILLLSDGLANAGITDPSSIAAEAQRIRENKISVSTMGVGLDYNENLMASIADHSGGNYYYVSNEMSMASVFQKEMNLMQNLVGTNAHATFDLGRGVQVTDIAGFKWEQSGRTLTIQIPDVYSGETKRIMVQFKVPTTSTKDIVLGSGKFVCTDISNKQPVMFTANFKPSVKVISDIHVVKNNEDPDIQQRSESVIAAKEMEKAYSLYEQGEADDAYKVAEGAIQRLRIQGASNQEQIKRYDENYRNLSPSAPAADTAAGKDFLKKQKLEERKVQQEDQKQNQR